MEIRNGTIESFGLKTTVIDTTVTIVMIEILESNHKLLLS